MRALMIAPTSFFSDYGGHIRILEEIRALREQDVDVAVVTYYKGNDVPGIDIRRTRPLPWHTDYEVGSSRHKFAYDVFLTTQSLREFRKFRPDIIHGHMHEGALIGGVLSRLFGVPLVFDYQGSLTAEMVDHQFLDPDGAIFPWVRRLETVITRRLPDAILASSGQAIKLLTDGFNVAADRIFALPDCADSCHFDPDRFTFGAESHPLLRKLGIPDGVVVVGYLGLLTDYQGIPDIIEAAAEMQRRNRKIHFLVMGFPNVDHYRSYARSRGLDDIMTFTGRVPFSDAPYYLAACDLAVAPKNSISEGSGKLLNYMAMGLPVVAYDTPVNREYLDDLGVYAPIGDVAAFCKAIIALSQDKRLRADLGQRLRQRVVENYSWEVAAERVARVYEMLTSR